MKSIIISKEIHGAQSEFQLLPLGRIDLEGDGPAILDDQSMDDIIKDFERRGNDMVIDYEHQTLKDIQAPAAGWVRKLLKRGSEGLWAVVEWTEKARKYLANREYRYFSPVMLTRLSDHKIVKLVNVALTNSPKINQLKPLVAKHGLDANLLQIAKQMGIDEGDLVKYGGDSFNPQEPSESDLKQAVLMVAKMMGVDESDLIKYGNDPSDSGLNETDADKIKRLLNSN